MNHFFVSRSQVVSIEDITDHEDGEDRLTFNLPVPGLQDHVTLFFPEAASRVEFARLLITGLPYKVVDA